MQLLRKFMSWLWHKPALLLVLATLMWAGNAVASRALAGQMSPLTVVMARWIIVCAILWPLLGRQFRAALPQMKLHWRYICLMGAFGYTAFNILFYSAGYYTTAVNLTLLQSAIPVFVMLGAVSFTGLRIRAAQLAGMAISTIGVLLVAGAGDLRNVANLVFNVGDLMALVACVFYAGYTLSLRLRPKLDPLVFFGAMAMAAALAGLPFFIGEVLLGHTYWPTPKGYAIVVYVALFPSLLSQLLYMRGVELIGASRAGLFSNLVPVFGAVLAVMILGEEFHTYHAVALALGLGGIYISEHFAKAEIPLVGPALN